MEHAYMLISEHKIFVTKIYYCSANLQWHPNFNINDVMWNIYDVMWNIMIFMM